MRTFACICLILTATYCFANAAMGYALEQYDGTAWCVYVVATVLFEAWMIGKWDGHKVPMAILFSILANLTTAGCCANLCGVGLHGQFVSIPILNMAIMFTGFGLLSGVVEGVVWTLFRHKRGALKAPPTLVGRSILVHLMWIPIGMIIMLIPNRPYPHLEGYENSRRLRGFQRAISKLRDADRTELRKIASVDDLLRLEAPNELPQGAYVAEYSRFSLGESNTRFEWNRAASKLDWSDPNRPSTWLIRARQDEGCFGIVASGELSARRSFDCKQLGYKER